MRPHSPDQRRRQADATSSTLYATADRPTAVLVDGSPLLDARRTAGIGRYVSSLLEALTAVQNIKVTVTLPQAPARESWKERFVAAQHGLSAALRHVSPDVVHSAVSEPLVGWPLRSQVVTLHDAIPWLASPHDPAHQCHLACRRRRLQQCGAVIAVSEAVNRDAAAVLGIEPGRVHVIPEGVGEVFSAHRRADDHARRLAAGVSSEGYALWVGSLRAHDPRKRLDCLLDAVARLGGSAPALVMVGARGDEGSRLALRAAALGVRLRLTDYVADATLAALYRGAAVALLPSSQEGFGLPALEAMACGTPVIASAVDALHELVGAAGMLVPAGDIDALAHAIATLIASGQLRARLSVAGTRRASRFNWLNAAIATAELYRNVARPPCSADRSLALACPRRLG